MMAALPDDILAKILSGVPLGEAKVRMQAVSRCAKGLTHLRELGQKLRNAEGRFLRVS